MPSNPQASSMMDLGDLLSLETTVLRVLCLTANSESSELKQRILEDLVDEDFYFPITRAILFATVSALNHSGFHVELSSLEQALYDRSVNVPDDFFLDDLFTGDIPSSATLAVWIARLKGEDSNVTPGAGAALEGLEKTRPSVGTSYGALPARKDDDSSSESTDAAALAEPPPVPDTEEAEKADTKESVVVVRSEPKKKKKLAASSVEPDDAVEVPMPPNDAAAVPSVSLADKSRADGSSQGAAVSEDQPLASETGGDMPEQDVLSPESGEWLGFLAELTKKQGERLKTGFHGFDAQWGGLGPGLLLLAGEQQRGLLDFLKQLVDQIAIHCRVPCLYLSFERSKVALRMLTLSRLSGASANDIENGRFEKDSSEWQSVVRAGEQAVEWLQRIYVVEEQPGLAVTRVRELREGLLGSGAGPTCLIAVDNLEKMASRSDLLQSVAELKELAESLGIAVVGAAAKLEPVHERSADMVVTIREDDGESILEVRTPGASEPTVLRFAYDSETHRFDEHSSD